MSGISVFARWWRRLKNRTHAPIRRTPPRPIRPWLEELEPRIQPSTQDGAFHVVMLDALRADPVFAGITGQGIGIADIDTGIYAGNPDLAPNIKAYYDAVVNSNPSQDPASNVATAVDYIGHGSHTAGISASSNPDIGVAYHADLIPIRVYLNGDPAPNPRRNTVTDALVWINANADRYNIKVVNMSLGSGGNFGSAPATNDPEILAIQALERRGIAVVISSGNSYAEDPSPGVADPSRYGTFTVGNTWSHPLQLPQGQLLIGGGENYRPVFSQASVDQFAASSQRGQLPIQIAAPGQEIYSTFTNQKPGLPGDPNHIKMSGTSMAAPLVTGMVALMQQAAQQFGGRYLSVNEIQQIALSTADTISDANDPTNGRILASQFQNGQITGSIQNLPETGLSYKRVNVYGAIKAVQALVSQSSGGGGGGSVDTNNTIATSVNLGAIDGTIVQTAGGRISTDGQVQTGAGDVDLFKITLTSTGVITPTITPSGANFFPYLNLFNAAGTLIDSNYDANTNQIYYTHFLANAIEPAGVYYVGVSAFKNNAYNIVTGAGAVAGIGTGTYQLSLTLTNPDPNGVIPGAVRDAGLPHSYNGIINSDPPPVNSSTRVQVGTGDVDMFQVVAPDDGNLLIEVIGDDSSFPVQFYSGIRVFDPQGHELARRTGYLENRMTFAGALRGQTYYVAVSDWTNVSYDPLSPYSRTTNGTGDRFYFLNLAFDNHDQNGTASTAVQLAVGQAATSFVGTDPDPNVPGGRIVVGHDGTKDVDFLLYQAPSSGFFDVTAVGTNGFIPSLSVWKLSADGSTINKIAATTQANAELIVPAAAGDYLWVAVTGQGNDNFQWFAPGSGSGGMTGICSVNVAMKQASASSTLTDNQVVAQGQPAQGVQTIAIGANLPASLGMDGNVAVGSADVDLYRFVAPLTINLTLHIDTSAELGAGTFLRFFNSAGQELKYSGDGNPKDNNNNLVVSVVAGQTYYIGVNGAGPSARSYDPLSGAGAAAAPNSTGSYVLSLAVAESPTGTITTDTPTFYWPLIGGADHYYVAVLDSATGQVVAANGNVAGQYWTVNPQQALTPGHVYGWFVGAVNNLGGITWNNGANIYLPPLIAPVATGPAGVVPAATGYDRPTFTWMSVAGANHYYAFVIDQTTGQGVVAINSNITGTQWTSPTTLTPGHTYAWFVAAYSSNNLAYTWNGGQSFKLAALAAPLQGAPAGSVPAAAGFDYPTFTWTPAPGALTYYVYVVDQADGHAVLAKPDAPGTSWHATTPLTPGHSFRWYLGAYSTNGQAATWSAGKNFALAPLPAGVGASPNGATSADPPTFVWNLVAAANSYYVYVVDRTNNQGVALSPKVTGNNWTPPTALPRGRNYTWYLGTLSTDGQAITWNAGLNFNIT